MAIMLAHVKSDGSVYAQIFKSSRVVVTGARTYADIVGGWKHLRRAVFCLVFPVRNFYEYTKKINSRLQ